MGQGWPAVSTGVRGQRPGGGRQWQAPSEGTVFRVPIFPILWEQRGGRWIRRLWKQLLSVSGSYFLVSHEALSSKIKPASHGPCSSFLLNTDIHLQMQACEQTSHPGRRVLFGNFT